MSTKKHSISSRRIRLAAWLLGGVSICSLAVVLATNPHYNPSAGSDDLHIACYQFQITQGGTFKAECIGKRQTNMRSGKTNTVAAWREINLNDHIGNLRYEKKLECGRTSFTSECKDLGVTLHANGVRLDASCEISSQQVGSRKGGGSGKTYRNIELELNDCIKSDPNDYGKLKSR